MSKQKNKKKTGAPYKLSQDEHRDLIRRFRSGQTAADLATHFRIGLMTVYQYLKLDPDSRSDK